MYAALSQGDDRLKKTRTTSYTTHNSVRKYKDRYIINVKNIMVFTFSDILSAKNIVVVPSSMPPCTSQGNMTLNNVDSSHPAAAAHLVPTGRTIPLASEVGWHRAQHKVVRVGLGGRQARKRKKNAQPRGHT